MGEYEAALDRIQDLVGIAGWIEAPPDLAPLLEETRGRYQGVARAAVLPPDTATLAAVLEICHQARIPLVPQGGNTGHCGGASPDDARALILGLGRMQRIRELDPDNYTMTVEAGCVLADLQRAAGDANRFFPLSLGAEGSCQIGGNLATNAGGINVLRYGNARDLTLGLEVVLADGRVWDGLNSLRKNNTGYDLRDLFVGSEGTLGIISAAVLKLFPRPADTQTAMVAVGSPDQATKLLARSRESAADLLTSFELLSRQSLAITARHIAGCRDPFPETHPWYVLLVMSGGHGPGALQGTMEQLLADAFDNELVTDAVLAQTDAQAQDFWRIREHIPEAQKRDGASIKHDVSVPVARVADFLGRADRIVGDLIPGVRPCAFGHLGDGNIHYNLSQPLELDRKSFLDQSERCNRAVHDLVAELRGSFSAEHGIGKLKLAEMLRYKPAIELELMGRIKTAFDPANILNPGKVLPAHIPSAADSDS